MKVLFQKPIEVEVKTITRNLTSYIERTEELQRSLEEDIQLPIYAGDN